MFLTMNFDNLSIPLTASFSGNNLRHFQSTGGKLVLQTVRIITSIDIGIIKVSDFYLLPYSHIFTRQYKVFNFFQSVFDNKELQHQPRQNLKW